MYPFLVEALANIGVRKWTARQQPLKRPLILRFLFARLRFKFKSTAMLQVAKRTRYIPSSSRRSPHSASATLARMWDPTSRRLRQRRRPRRLWRLRLLRLLQRLCQFKPLRLLRRLRQLRRLSRLKLFRRLRQLKRLRPPRTFDLRKLARRWREGGT